MNGASVATARTTVNEFATQLKEVSPLATGLEKFPQEAATVMAALGSLHTSLGEAEKAKRWMARALAIDPDDTNIIYNAACMWAQLGETDRALDLLDGWASRVGRESMDWMQQDPDLDSLRDRPRYKKIMKLMETKTTERLGL